MLSKKGKSVMHGRLNNHTINRYTEKILYVIVVFCIIFLVGSQIGLYNETTRTFLTDIDKYEGVNVSHLEDAFKQGKLTLKLIGTLPSDNIYILINGYESHAFSSETIVLKVRNNSVIEIDGTNVATPFRVKIIETSDNIATKCIHKEITVNLNIEILTRIFLK